MPAWDGGPNSILLDPFVQHVFWSIILLMISVFVFAFTFIMSVGPIVKVIMRIYSYFRRADEAERVS